VEERRRWAAVERQVGSGFQRMSGQRGRRTDFKWPGVLGSLVLVLGEQKPRTPGDGDCLGEWAERVRFLGFFCGLGFFLWFFLLCFKIALLFFVCWRPVFIGKNIARFSNLVPQLLSFCKFNFS
jgi:hypothetical protein